jgi:hypothetical protein
MVLESYTSGIEWHSQSAGELSVSRKHITPDFKTFLLLCRYIGHLPTRRQASRRAEADLLNCQQLPGKFVFALCLLVGSVERSMNRGGYGYARLLLLERQQELRILDLKYRGMLPLPRNYLSCRRSLLQAIDQLETLLRTEPEAVSAIDGGKLKE